MPLHTILFDFDGTLADSASCAIIATQQAFRDHQLPVPPDTAIVQQMGIPIERCFRTLGATALDDATFATLLATFASTTLPPPTRTSACIPASPDCSPRSGRRSGKPASSAAKKAPFSAPTAMRSASARRLTSSSARTTSPTTNRIPTVSPAPSPGLIAPPPAPFTSAMPPPTSRQDALRASKPALSPGAHMTRPPLPPPARMRWCMMSPPCNTCCCRQWHGSRVGGIENRLPACGTRPAVLEP